MERSTKSVRGDNWSLKLHVDGRFTQVNERLDKLEKKMDVNTVGLVEMIERGFGEVLGIRIQVDNHEGRIATLEARDSRASGLGSKLIY